MVSSPDGVTADEHELCGLTLIGRTKNGEYPPSSYTDENGVSVNEYEVVHIQLESTSEELDRSVSLYVSLDVVNNTVGHALWDNYHIRNAKVSFSKTVI